MIPDIILTIERNPYRSCDKQDPECHWCHLIDQIYTKAVWFLDNEWYCNACADELYGD